MSEGNKSTSRSDGGCCLAACKAATCCGVPIHIHWAFPIFMAFAVIDCINSKNNGWVIIALILVNGPALWVTVTLHELAHAAAAKIVKIPVKKIMIWPLGGVTFLGASNPTKLQMLFIHIAGPLSHIPLFFIFYFIHLAMNFGEYLPLYTTSDGSLVYFAMNVFFYLCSLQQLVLLIFNGFVVRVCLQYSSFLFSFF
jgi:Zn-dependent protease